MKILHITPHLGGGVGTVIMGWMDKIRPNSSAHEIVCLDYANIKAGEWAIRNDFHLSGNMGKYPRLWQYKIERADIVVCHFWDHPMLDELFCDPIPECRLVFWCHKNITATMFNPVWWDKVLNYPDRFINTSPIQGCGCDYIWSTGDMSMFLEIKPKPHKGFVIGYVGTVDYKKLHRNFIPMCKEIAKAIPDATFLMVGESRIERDLNDRAIFTGKVDDVAPYLAEFDVFGYPLRPDHYGTCEQSLGEAMAAGAVPVVMDNPAERTIVTNQYSGIIATSEVAYIQWIRKLALNPGLRSWMSRNARESAEKLYSIDTMIHQWNEVFEEMMKQPKKSRNPI